MSANDNKQTEGGKPEDRNNTGRPSGQTTFLPAGGMSRPPQVSGSVDPGPNRGSSSGDNAFDNAVNSAGKGVPGREYPRGGGALPTSYVPPPRSDNSRDRSEYNYVDRDGVFYDDSQMSFNKANKAMRDMGFSPTITPEATLAAARVNIERVDVMPRKKALVIMKSLLDNIIGDDDKQVGFVVILKHFALNSSSTRSPDDVRYLIGGVDLFMRDVRQQLGDDARRFFRAFADETVEVIRNDRAFQRQLASRYQCSPEDAMYHFDAADCISNLTQAARHKVNIAKANVLKLTAVFDNRPVNHALVEHADKFGGSNTINENV